MRTGSGDGEPPCTLTILGSGGWMPTLGRQTCCAVVRRGSEAMLIDAGTGLAHLPHQPGLLEGVENLAIVLTHFHADHVVGLCYSGGLSLPAPPTIFGPGRALYGAATETILSALVGHPTTHASLAELWPDVRDLPSLTPEVCGFSLELRVQHLHTAPTIAIRIEDMAAYITDTGFDPDNGAFAAGVDLVVHEAWWHSGHLDSPETHSSGRDAGRTAAAAGASRLALMHLHPTGDHQAVLVEARAEHTEARLAADVETRYVLA
ncbi:MAG: MBL fold metallo-hydrolase [Solirubrobacteraceae bacterium]